MRKLSWLLAFSTISLLSSCEIIGSIFKAGAYTGIFIVLVLIIFVIWLLSKIMRKN
jgi:hypothetical protein